MTDKNIEKKFSQEEYANKAFWLSLGSIGIFGVPAFMGLFIGLSLEEYYETSRWVTVIILCGTCLLSWGILWHLYRKLQQQYQS